MKEEILEFYKQTSQFTDLGYYTIMYITKNANNPSSSF